MPGSEPTSGFGPKDNMHQDVLPTRLSLPGDIPGVGVGTVLSGRYQIIQTLGVGGMGTVYKAFDQELSRIVALKTILPELAASPAALNRFKQEVLLAQRIVHKNVVRIFDIGEDGPLRFITMEFIEGVDLKTYLSQRGTLPPTEAAAIVREVCVALDAAHAAGVVHRDLKPQNIMIAPDGHVCVMDFGIAQSAQSRGGTITGTLMGTPEYMSPEQARLEGVDHRSDIFSLGLIFYELLTGNQAFHGDTVVETLFVRTKESAVPPSEIDPKVPKVANDIVVKCLQIDREKRYQTIAEILHDLGTNDPSQLIAASAISKPVRRQTTRYRKWIALSLAVLASIVAAFLVRAYFGRPPALAHDPQTVLIADFMNQTDDPVFDGTLEPVVKIALEGAVFISAYDRPQVVRTLGLAPIAGRLDEAAAVKIALSQGLNVVLSGTLRRQGGGYLLSIKAIRPVTGETISIAESTASDKAEVLLITTTLAGRVRKALGDDTSESAQRFGNETLTSVSLEAIHEYATAMEALSNGKHEEALQNFSEAVKTDSNFGLAYAGMAIASVNLRRQGDAEKYIQLANSHLGSMTERERYRTRGSYYLIFGNRRKCVEEYGTLIAQFPSDVAAYNNLALCSTQLRELTKGIEVERKAAAILPKRAMYRFNIAVYTAYNSDFQTAEREARAVQELDASYDSGFVALAFAQLGSGQLTRAAETYQNLEKMSLAKNSKAGVSRAAAGLADLAIYEGRFDDSAKILEQGAASDVTNKYRDRAAAKFAALAYARLLQGKKEAAIQAAQAALDAAKTVEVRFLAGRIFALAGQPAQAKQLAMGLAAELQTEPQAYAKLIDGDVALQDGDARRAIGLFTEANTMLDTWIGRFELGRAYLEAKAFVEADSEFDRCIKRRGEALSLFLEETPTYGYFPQVYYYLGRVREGTNSPDFADLYRSYLQIREKAGEDPLLPEIHSRISRSSH